MQLGGLGLAAPTTPLDPSFAPRGLEVPGPCTALAAELASPLRGATVLAVGPPDLAKALGAFAKKVVRFSGQRALEEEPTFTVVLATTDLWSHESARADKALILARDESGPTIVVRPTAFSLGPLASGPQFRCGRDRADGMTLYGAGLPTLRYFPSSSQLSGYLQRQGQSGAADLALEKNARTLRVQYEVSTNRPQLLEGGTN